MSKYGNILPGIQTPEQTILTEKLKMFQKMKKNENSKEFGDWSVYDRDQDVNEDNFWDTRHQSFIKVPTEIDDDLPQSECRVQT